MNTAFEELFEFPEHDLPTARELEKLMRNENIPQGSFDYLVKFDKHIQYKPISYHQSKNPFYKISQSNTKWIRNLLRDFLIIHRECSKNGNYSFPFYVLMEQDSPLKNSAHKKQSWAALFEGIVAKHSSKFSKTDFSKKQIDAILKFLEEFKTINPMHDIVMEEV